MEVLVDCRGENSMSDGSADEREGAYKFDDDLHLLLAVDCGLLRLLRTVLGGDPG